MRGRILAAVVALLVSGLLVAVVPASAQASAPQCLLQADLPAPPDGGAVFARPLDPSSSKPNVVVISPDSSWDTDSCGGSGQGSGDVMTHPTSISNTPINGAPMNTERKTYGSTDEMLVMAPLSAPWARRAYFARNPLV